MLIKHGQQKGQAPSIDPLGTTTRHWHRRLSDESLRLDEQWTCSLHRARDDGAGDATSPITQEPGARIGHANEPFLGHLKQPKLTGRPKPMLYCSKQTHCVIAIAFEREHRVDDVLKHAGPGERPFFRHVTHEDHGDSPLFRHPHERVSTLTHLGDAAGR